MHPLVDHLLSGRSRASALETLHLVFSCLLHVFLNQFHIHGHEQEMIWFECEKNFLRNLICSVFSGLSQAHHDQFKYGHTKFYLKLLFFSGVGLVQGWLLALHLLRQHSRSCWGGGGGLRDTRKTQIWPCNASDLSALISGPLSSI